LRGRWRRSSSKGRSATASESSSTKKDLEAGAIIPEEIRRHLESCEEFLVLLTSLSISRQWVLLELGAAWGLRKHIAAITDKVADDDLLDIIRQTTAYGLNDFDRFVSELVGRAKRRRVP
jgi:hypothetical protein